MRREWRMWKYSSILECHLMRSERKYTFGEVEGKG